MPSPREVGVRRYEPRPPVCCCYCGQKGPPFAVLLQRFSIINGDPYTTGGRESYMCRECIKDLARLLKGGKKHAK